MNKASYTRRSRLFSAPVNRHYIYADGQTLMMARVTLLRFSPHTMRSTFTRRVTTKLPFPSFVLLTGAGKVLLPIIITRFSE